MVGLALVGATLFDAFETIVVPRRVSRRLRLARYFYVITWRPYSAVARKVSDAARRETFLSFYGPSSLLLLVGLWAIILIVGFATLQWAGGSVSNTASPERDFGTDLYFSGTTFFTLGLGDVVPDSGITRLLAVIEGGTGFAFLALLIGYLPLVYQMFARREANVSLLDQRAGSPPTTAELLRRNVAGGDPTELIRVLREWELWVGDLLESHLSYPSLAYFRSQHENQSWVAALGLILDVSGFVLASGSRHAGRQAGFTFAVARHAVGDLGSVFGLRPRPTEHDRLDPVSLARLLDIASKTGLIPELCRVETARLAVIRGAYEPYLRALSEHLLMELPAWVPERGATDNWETTAWDFASVASLLGPGSPFTSYDADACLASPFEISDGT